MKSQMLNRRFKKATVLVSRQTLEQAIQEGEALAEKLLQTNPNDPLLDQIEQAVARLQGVLQMSPQDMAADGASSLEDFLDDAKQPGYAAEIKKDVDMIAQNRQSNRMDRPAPGTSNALGVAAGAGSSDPAWTTDRDENGQPKLPETAEVPRIAAKKKEAEPAAVAPAPAPAASNPIDYIPTESLLKIIEDMPKDEDFAQNPGKQDALIELTNILKTRPVMPAEPVEGAAGAALAPAPVTASSKVAVAPPGWENTVKEMKNHKDISNPFALAWSMKDKGYTTHKASFVLRKRGAAYIIDKFAGTSPTQWTDDGKKGDIVEDGGRTPEVAQAHKLKDEAPAKLDRPSTTDMMKLASAVKDAESVGEKLKAMYLDAKPLLTENSTAPVRNFVESIYKAYSLCDDAVKTLNKQEMQEKAEAEATDIKKNNKKSSLLGLRFAAAE